MFKSLRGISLYCTVLGLVFISSLLVWLPFLLKGTSLQIYANYDGPLYIIPAKTFYNPVLIKQILAPLTPEYYAAHLPLYPIFIAVFAPAMGFLKSMIFVNQ